MAGPPLLPQYASKKWRWIWGPTQHGGDAGWSQQAIPVPARRLDFLIEELDFLIEGLEGVVQLVGAAGWAWLGIDGHGWRECNCL
ncbi:hypothetical protein METBIDRAFT_189834 [Metschnikowia bicuspidata var. bicuspidata NRRL YB-4993]|uniref:Uncharacterized protein n=1 Tax=Metschnikowia bicuspidata var. bicuspidata NRRL YB-4993 TaxID=869754 RepID=A0A1A0HCA7_9ASCO|nr:hypothetical protein METBIDRAFT_189834 [Metschnikowia bicuspidata var. bicuspidata NRRL YB-4993]OBA21626.1 hypothetical protein METBIDRAFT_189834 [Metschnikowia bicuspidata var. bicuspidata NRRL YB-4993]